MKVPYVSIGAPLAALALLTTFPVPARSMPAHNVPNGAVIGHYEGRVDPAKEMNLTIVLKRHNQAEFDKACEDLYDPASSRYQQWFTEKDLERYAPTPQEFATVKNELVRQGFTVVSEDPQRFMIRVHGTAAIVEKAFQTELDLFSYNGRVFQAHSRDAQLAGPAGDLIEGISGLERHDARPHWSVLRNPLTGEPIKNKKLGGKDGSVPFLSPYTNAPLTASVATKLKTPGASLPTATYTGLQYGANGDVGGLAPADLQSHYGVPFTQGATTYNGKGQTIALVEAYGYGTIEADANTAASMSSLPTLNSSNFAIILTQEGQKLNPTAAVIAGWDVEIALDVQSAHALAPGAKIDVVVSPAQDNEDMLNAMSYVIAHNLANTVSDSWGEDVELLSGPLEESAFNSVAKSAASKGISFQFSTGDGGDNGFGTPQGTISVPANSPYVTAVGGTSVLNNPYGSGQIVTGWGSNWVEVYFQGVVYPLVGYFNGGAGGGESLLYPAPTWQSSLHKSWRVIPDVSAVADPATGFPVVITEEGVQFGEIVGGTSLASPVFSAIWATADQYNGKSLGQAAPHLQKLSSTEITDVVPPATTHDVTGSIKDKTGTTHSYSYKTLFTDAGDVDNPGSTLSLYGQSAFLSALWPNALGEQGFDLVLSFGTDSSLTVGTGWDDVTGWGEPNGVNFIKGVTGKLTGVVD